MTNKAPERVTDTVRLPGGQSLVYTLIRSSRRTISLEIGRDGEVRLRAPRRYSLTAARSVVRERTDWICRQLARQQARREARPEPDEAQLLVWRRQAQQQIPPRVAYYARQMGVFPVSVKINAAKTRFGSCSRAGRLNFSCRLMAYPPAAIDYVVVHELAHLRHMDHSPAFYREVETYLPDYRERRALLK